MRRELVPGSLSVLAAFLFTACVVPTPAGVGAGPDPARVLQADARALRFGATAPEVFDNPQLRENLRGLFGADWNPGPARAFGAPAFFPASASIRMARVGDREYIAITGCVVSACADHRGLLLIGSDEQLLARLDDGGFSHYYHFGRGATGDALTRSTIDEAWLALERVERG